MVQILGVSADGIFFTVIVLFLPLIKKIISNVVQRNQQPPATPVAKTPMMKALTVLVTLHSIYIASQLIFSRPSNIFSSLSVPFALPTPAIKEIILSHSPSGLLPPHLEALLVRLQTYDARALYIRFGHDVVQYCDYCHSFTDFALFYVPPVALQYIRTIVVIGLMTERGSGKGAWRLWFVGAVVAAGLFEAWTLVTAKIEIPRNGESITMWHDRAWDARHALFLTLPLILHALPYHPDPLSRLMALPNGMQTLMNSLNQLQVLKLVRSASMRDATLRNRVGEWWEEEARSSAIARQSQEIEEEASRAGLGYTGEESPLLDAAKARVLELRGILQQRWAGDTTAASGDPS